MCQNKSKTKMEPACSAGSGKCICMGYACPLRMRMGYGVLTSVPPLPRSSLAAISPVQPSVFWSLMEMTSSPGGTAHHTTVLRS